MGAPDLRAITASGDSFDDPSEDLMYMLLDDIAHGAEDFVIVERVGHEGHFCQVTRQGAQWLVEHRDGGQETHVGAVAPDQRTVHGALTAWAFELDDDSDELDWKPVDY